MEKEKLTINVLEKEKEKINKTICVKVLNKYYVNLRPYITNTDMNNIFSDFGKWVQNENVQKEIGDKPILHYLMCFLVKYNTDIFEDKKYNDIDLLNIMNGLIELNFLDDLLSHFEKTSLSLVYIRFDEIMKVSKKIDDIKKKAQGKNENI